MHKEVLEVILAYISRNVARWQW